MSKGWDEGTTAEVRRMASHKIAAELVKLGFQGEIGNEEFYKFFFAIVDKLDQDVIEVGSRARAAEQMAVPPPKQMSQVTPTEPAELLNDLQQKKMYDYLNQFVVDGLAEKDEETDKIAKGPWKLKLWTMNLPNNISHKDVVKQLTVEQGMEIYGWVKETQQNDAA